MSDLHPKRPSRVRPDKPRPTTHAPAHAPGLVLGAELPCPPAGFGFASRAPAPPAQPDALLRHDRPAHGLVFSATGGGKGTGVLIPNLLMHEGSACVWDPKGEIAAVTARRRRQLGEVVIIDPFEVLGPETGSLNPMDVLRLPGMSIDDSAETLAWELSAGHESAKDPFWQNTATGLLAGLIANAAADPDPSRRHLGAVADALSVDDVTYSIALAMDEKRVYSDFARKRFSEYLQVPDGSAATRGCILASAQQYVKCFQSDRVRRCMAGSSVSLADLREGRRTITVYFVFPVTRIKSHRGLLRLWLSVILTTLAARPTLPAKQTLVAIDEAANLGRLDQLAMMHSYLRGSGAFVLTAWQSLGQLLDLYPTEWRTIVENCGTIQAFSLHPTSIESLATLLGTPAAMLRSLAPNEQLVIQAGQPARVLARVDYRSRDELRLLADPNPRYAALDGSELIRDQPSGREERASLLSKTDRGELPDR